MKKLLLLVSLILIFALTACSVGSSVEDVSTTSTGNNQETTTVSVETTLPTAANTVADALIENQSSHEDAEDLVWDAASVIQITLLGDTIEANAAGVSVAGSTVTISAAGTYQFSGSLSDGQILINTEDKEIVRLILDGVDLHSSTSAPIYVMAADEVVLVLAKGSQNRVSDGSEYVTATADGNEPNAAIFSMADLTIYGTGSLMVEGNYNDGIASKDGLVIASGTLIVSAPDDGIRGKDYLVVDDGNLTIQSQGDGLVSDNAEDAAKGYVSIEAGVFNISTAGDAIQAETDVLISSGDFTLTTGGGSEALPGDSNSAKGIKGAVSVNIEGGNFSIDSADDAIHSNDSVVINGGAFVISSGDDGVHADATLVINNGEFSIQKSYEGIESAAITINGGNLNIVSSDDGINIAAGNDGSGSNQGMMPGMRPGMGGGAGQDAFTTSGNNLLTIHGGLIVVEAAGDGLDVNGSITMTGGVVLVNGPTEQMNGAIDYDGFFNISGGLIAAAGSAGMAMAPSASSGQNSLLVFFSSNQPAGTLVHIQDDNGTDVFTFAPTKQFQSFAFSSPDLMQGSGYQIYLGGSSTGTLSGQDYEGGTYSGGTLYSSVTISAGVTQVGTGGMGGRPGGGGPRP